MIGDVVCEKVHGNAAAPCAISKLWPSNEKTGDIRAAVHRIFHHNITRGLVERSHLAVDAVKHGLFDQIPFAAVVSTPTPSGLVRVSASPGFAPLLVSTFFGCTEARNRQSVNRLGT